MKPTFLPFEIGHQPPDARIVRYRFGGCVIEAEGPNWKQTIIGIGVLLMDWL